MLPPTERAVIADGAYVYCDGRLRPQAERLAADLRRSPAGGRSGWSGAIVPGC